MPSTGGVLSAIPSKEKMLLDAFYPIIFHRGREDFRCDPEAKSRMKLDLESKSQMPTGARQVKGTGEGADSSAPLPGAMQEPALCSQLALCAVSHIFSGGN